MGYEPDTKLRDIRKSGQVIQPNAELPPDDNGWPEPLTDPSTPYKIGVTNGKNGEQSQMDGAKTSQDVWSLAEGTPPTGGPEADGVDGQRAQGEKTTQKIWSDPGGSGAKAMNPDIDGDTPVRNSDPLKTSSENKTDQPFKD